MNNDIGYRNAIEQANANFVDAQARGEDAIGGDVFELFDEIFTPEEIAASNLRVEMMSAISRARRERGLTQQQLEEMSGVKQPVIARMEKGNTKSQIDTVLKVLAPLGKTLYIGDLPAKAKA